MPYINNTPTRRLSISELSGGVNYRDAISNIKDNQLADSLNVEYKNGMLKTRPGFKAHENAALLMDGGRGLDVKIYSKKEWCQVIDGKMYFLSVVHDSKGLTFRFHRDFEVIHATLIPAEFLPDADFSCNIFNHGEDIYCFCSGYYSKPENYIGEWTPFYIFKVFRNDGGEWNYVRITQNDVYIPTLALDGQAANPRLKGSDPGFYAGVSFENYNLLGRKCKLLYATVNPKRLGESQTDDASPEDRNHLMDYAVLIPNFKYSESKETEFFNNVEIIVTNTKGKVVTHTFDYKNSDDNQWEESKAGSDGLRLTNGRFSGNWLCFDFFRLDGGEYIPASVKAEDEVRNNMEIIYSTPEDKEGIRKVMNMTFSEWFGGYSEGLYGGIHLFLGGNLRGKEKALVCWSDFNKPLYFSESGYTYVGDKSQKVTAFGKQGDELIIFKQREIFSTSYSSSSSVIDAEELERQSVVDITSADVMFAMNQVHGYIGCNYPNTIQLCRNRLCWMQSGGKVYTLVSANQYNERSIFEVSGMIENRLKNQSNLSSAVSADHDGKYILAIGNALYVMDYNSYGFANVASYTKTEDSQINIPWWIWETPTYPKCKTVAGETTITPTPLKVVSLVSLFEGLYVFAKAEAQSGDETYVFPELFLLGGEEDWVPKIEYASGQLTRNLETQNINSMIVTKSFDFGNSTIRKSIPKAEMCFGNNGGAPITVTVITEKGENIVTIVPDGEYDDRNIKYFFAQAVRNENRNCKFIGYKIESEGNIALGEISLVYKVLGGIK